MPAESLTRRAELLREMADATGDSALYQQAIEAYRSVVGEHTHSAFVGEALTGIAQIYQENLQDLDGAAAAYKELISYFPSSVLAREARAVLSRFEAELKHRPVDVMIASDRVDRSTGTPTLTNVRNFSGPDYARVVVDLSDPSRYSERRVGNRLSIQLDGAAVSSSLFGRPSLSATEPLKRFCFRGRGWTAQGSVQINIDVGTLSHYSTFRLSDPERIVIDLHAGGSNSRTTVHESSSNSSMRPDRTVDANEVARDAAPRTNVSAAERNAMKSLPEISDPILPLVPGGPADPAASAASAAAKVDAKAANSPIKRIVIDPGHGGQLPAP
jgi:N-acetylmuramoyl-L-alanine amidase